MTFDGFLSFLALIAALYAVAPSVTRLAIRIHSLNATLASTLALAAVLYLLLFQTWGQPCSSMQLCGTLVFDPPRTIAPNQAAFFVVLAWLVFVIWLLSRARIPASALPGLARLVDELADENRYAELIKFTEPQLHLLDTAACRELPLQRVSDTLRRWHPTRARIEDVIGSIERQDEAPPWWKKVVARLFYPLVPRGEAAEASANQVLRRLMRTQALRVHIATYRPDFGARLVALKTRLVHDFAAQYLQQLISQPGSALYEEISQNQNLATRGYQLPERNRLLHVLFADATRAEALGVWQPIGEFAIAQMREDNHPEYVNFLRGNAEHIEDERWRDPVFVAIRFFDIMVQSALYQGIKWHMWLFYMRDLSEALTSAYDDTGPGVDQSAEWPTRCSYLLYQTFSVLTDWLEGARHLKDGEHHLAIESDNTEHENDNIPKSAALCLGDCMRALLLSSNVPRRFKDYLAEVVFRSINDLSKGGQTAKIRSAAINSVVQGGILANKPNYGTALRDTFSRIDHILRSDLKDFAAALDRQYPRQA